MKNKSVWIGGIIGFVIGLILSLLMLIRDLIAQKIPLYSIIMITGLTLLGIFIGAVVREKRNKAIWIGALIGGIWGFFSYIFGVWSLEAPTFNNILFNLPLYIAYKISRYFGFISSIRGFFFIFGSIIIGVLIGLLIGWLISKLRKGK